MPKAYFKTFGCQMNEHDSETMRALLGADGYSSCDEADEADVIVINTCSIRDKSYQKAVSVIGQNGKGLRSGRKPVVAVTGCVVSHDGQNILKRFPFVDVVLGPDHIAALPQAVRKVWDGRERVSLFDFKDISDYEFPSPLLGSRNERRVKAYVTIMKGCDNNCSFCIVPFVRGREVSRPLHGIVEEIRGLEAQGVSEVMLLGQNVNSYGKQLPEKTNFARLLRLIDEKTAIARIRYTSPHPKDFSADLMREHGRNQKLCPHVHLPVQSGSNRILKRMRRSYTREVYLRKVEEIRKVVPAIAMTTDIIVGFPGETGADFEETLSLMKEVGYDASYSFTFSPRPKTEAAGFADDVPSEVKKARLERLQELQAEISLEKNKSLIGRSEEVLVEGLSRSSSSPCELTGRTPHGRIVNFHGDVSLIGAILPVEIHEASAYSLKGTLCS